MHDINMAAAYCDYGVAMKYGEIAFQGTMDDLMTSDTLFTSMITNSRRNCKLM